MDFNNMFTVKEETKCESREEIFDPKLKNDFMIDSWSPDAMDLLDPMLFESELFNFNGIDELSTQIKLEAEEYDKRNNVDNSISNNSSTSNSNDSSNNSMTYDSTASVLENFLSQCDVINGTSISSNSSDSGLSSDNLETELSPEYEAFSPAASSPGPSISERGEKNSPPRNESYVEHLYTGETVNENSSTSSREPPTNQLLQSSAKPTTVKSTTFRKIQPQPSQIQSPPKVIVQKVPQIVNLRPVTSSAELTTVTSTKRTFNQTFLENVVIKQEKGIKIVKLSPQSTITSSGTLANGKKMVTIQLKNSSTIENGKLQTKPGTFVINNKGKLTEVKKLIPVQTPTVSTTSNPRSILLPVTMQNVKGLKTYKVVNMPTLKCYGNMNNNKNLVNITTLKPAVQQNAKIIVGNKPKISGNQVNSDAESLIFEDNDYIEEYDNDDDDDDEEIEVERISPAPIKTGKLSSKTAKSTTTSDDSDSPYPRLILSSEEKRLLAKEGITLPSHYPLTKYEERELKRIRRKIRNKISAQDSRKRKKEYVDGLEERVKQCTEENQTLIKKLKILQTQNQNLMSQMKKLQAMLSRGTNKTAHPTTCLLVLLLSLALVATPNLKLGNQNAKEAELNELAQNAANEILQSRRNLLFDVKDHQNNDIFDEDFNMNDFITLNDAAAATMNGGEHGGDLATMIRNCKRNNNSNNEPFCKKFKKDFIDFDVDDFNWYQAKETQKQEESKYQKNVYELAVDTYNKNKSQQTSGFNIEIDGNNGADLFDMMKQRSNPELLELNFDKLASSTNNVGTTTSTIAVE